MDKTSLDITPNEIRFRLRNPRLFETFRYIDLSSERGIRAVVGIADGRTVLQSLRFRRKQWTPRKALSWLKSHWHKLCAYPKAMQVCE